MSDDKLLSKGRALRAVTFVPVKLVLFFGMADVALAGNVLCREVLC